MGIIGSILRRGESAAGHRTIDGGHPAPYPDMTDEQLYNYELTFNVPRKTFDRPPAPAEPLLKAIEDNVVEKVLDSTRFNARRTHQAPPPQATPLKPVAATAPLDLSRPVRLVTTRQPVEIITTRARHPIYKVHGYIGDDSVVTVFTLDGQLSENGPCYLENVPEQRQLHLNIYPNPDASSDAGTYLITQHETRQQADAAATSQRLACVAVQFDE